MVLQYGTFYAKNPKKVVENVDSSSMKFLWTHSNIKSDHDTVNQMSHTTVTCKHAYIQYIVSFQ